SQKSCCDIAPIVVEAAERAIKGLAKTTGVCSAGQAFEARDFLESLSPAQVSFELQRDNDAAHLSCSGFNASKNLLAGCKPCLDCVGALVTRMSGEPSPLDSNVEIATTEE